MKKLSVALATVFLFATLTAFPASAGEYVLFYHNDALGSPVALTDSSGNVVWRTDYEPFGNLATLTETLPNTHQFIGKEVDAETSLHYLGARFYDGSLGRFLSVDPVLLRGRPAATLFKAQLHNLYAYSANNPYRFVDRDGNSPLDIAFLIWDSGKLGYALYTGSGVGEALVDVGLSAAGVLSPVPGAGQVLKAARTAEHAVEAARGAEKVSSEAKTIAEVSRGSHPEAAQHIEEAIAAGQPSVLTIGDKASTSARRREALKGVETKTGKDRDEYPPAMFGEGGSGASVKHISPSDNRGAGACIGAQCRGLNPGDKVTIKVVK